MTSSNDLAAGSKLQDTTFHGDASPSAWVKRCSTAMGARLAVIGAASQPGSRRQASMSSRKLPPRTHHSDELPTGPFSRRNLVDNFPSRSIGAEDRGQQEQQNWFHRESLVLAMAFSPSPKAAAWTYATASPAVWSVWRHRSAVDAAR